MKEMAMILMMAGAGTLEARYYGIKDRCCPNQDGSWEDKKRRGHCKSSFGEKVSEHRLQRFCQKDG